MAQGPEGARSVYLLPEHMKDRFGLLIPVPFEADVFTEYGVAYLPDRADDLADLLELARREFCAG